jgi:hypothetical protein
MCIQADPKVTSVPFAKYCRVIVRPMPWAAGVLEFHMSPTISEQYACRYVNGGGGFAVRMTKVSHTSSRVTHAVDGGTGYLVVADPLDGYATCECESFVRCAGPVRSCKHTRVALQLAQRNLSL